MFVFYKLATFQEYETQEKFDFAFFIHSWYGLGLHKEYFEKALSYVKPGGLFMINIASKLSPVNKITLLERERKSGGKMF